jgi:thiamine biosynthesis lipoprotein
MGTTASLDVPGLSSPDPSFAEVERVFEEAEHEYSLYRDDSELSRVNAGEITLRQADPDVRDEYDRALLWRSATGGTFTPNRPDGKIDLSEIVKATTIQAAGDILHAAGLTDWCLNVGGDVLVSGQPNGDNGWAVGVVDPDDRAALLCSIRLAPGQVAVATSGSAERGDHIWLGGTTQPAHFVQVTVVADTIEKADVLATSIIAGGPATLELVTDSWHVDVLTVDRQGALTATPGFRASLAR